MQTLLSNSEGPCNLHYHQGYEDSTVKTFMHNISLKIRHVGPFYKIKTKQTVKFFQMEMNAQTVGTCVCASSMIQTTE